MDAQMQKDFIKGGAFLIEDRTAGEVFTPEDLTEEQRMIGETTREFVDTEVRPNLGEMEKHNWQLSRELIVKAGELGLLGANIPEEYGGARGRLRRRLRRADFYRTFADSLFRLGRIETKMDSADCFRRSHYGLLFVGSGKRLGRAWRKSKCKTFRRRNALRFERRKNVDYKWRFCRCFHRVCEG